MKCSGRICLALLFVLDLAWASATTAQAPEKILFLNKSSPHPIRFVVEGKDRLWFGWGWKEGATAIDLYPADRTVNSDISEPVLKVNERVSTMQLEATESQFPEIGIGPGRELWLLATPGAPASLAEPWERLLDAVEAAYRQRTRLQPGEPIGTLGTCEILSFPVETEAAEWRSTWTLENASPDASAENPYQRAAGDEPSGKIQIRRFMRWVRPTTDSGSCGDAADLRLFPVEKIASDQKGDFLEITGAKARSLSFAEIAPEAWTPGSRIRAEGLSHPASVAAVVESAKGDIDLCTRQELQDLCKTDQTLRQRLYAWDPQTSLLEEIRKPLEEACSKALREPCANKTEWQGSVAGVFVRSYAGPVQLSKEPPIESRSVNGQVQWSTAWEGEGLEAPIRLLDDSVVQIALKTPAAEWSRDNTVAMVLLASIGLFVLVAYWSRHSPRWDKVIEWVEKRSFNSEDATSPAPAVPSQRPGTPTDIRQMVAQALAELAKDSTSEIGRLRSDLSGIERRTKPLENPDNGTQPSGLEQVVQGYREELSNLKNTTQSEIQKAGDGYQTSLEEAFDSYKTGLSSLLTEIQETARKEKDDFSEYSIAKLEELENKGQSLEKAFDSYKTELSGLLTELRGAARKEMDDFSEHSTAKLEELENKGQSLEKAFDSYKTELSGLLTELQETARKEKDDFSEYSTAKLEELENKGRALETQLSTVDESVRRRLVELATEDLKITSQTLMENWPKEASKLVSRDLNESVQRAVEQETLTKWSFFMDFLQDLESLLRSPERVTQLLALATLAERSPAIAQRLEDLSLILPAEGTLATLNPDDPQLRLATRRDGHEYAVQRYRPLVEEILGLGGPEQGQILSSLEAASRLGYWTQALLGTLERGFKLDLRDQWLPAPAHSEFDQAILRAWTYVTIDAPVFRNLVRMIKEGGVDRPGAGSPPALLGYGEGSFLEGAGLTVQHRSLPERLRNFFAPLNQIGRLGEVCLALQYLVEAFPAEQLQPKDRSDLEKELKRSLGDHLPPGFHKLIGEVAVGFGLRYKPVPYYKARLDDSQYKFIGREVTAISLEQRTGRDLSGVDRFVVVRLQRPFLEDDDEHGIYYAGHAHVANV